MIVSADQNGSQLTDPAELSLEQAVNGSRADVVSVRDVKGSQAHHRFRYHPHRFFSQVHQTGDVQFYSTSAGRLTFDANALHADAFDDFVVDRAIMISWSGAYLEPEMSKNFKFLSFGSWEAKITSGILKHPCRLSSVKLFQELKMRLFCLPVHELLKAEAGNEVVVLLRWLYFEGFEETSGFLHHLVIGLSDFVDAVVGFNLHDNSGDKVLDFSSEISPDEVFEQLQNCLVLHELWV